jgi:CRISPR system Cascade subunit CasE
MYLSRLTLNPRSRQARHDLGDCQQLHRTVMSLFQNVTNGAARAELGVLYRVETHPRSGVSALLIQSRVAPSWPALPPGYALDTGAAPPNPHAKAVGAAYASLCVGHELVFRLRANPTRKIDTKSGPDGARRNGKRVELCREDEQIAWLARKGIDGGFQLRSVRVKPSIPDVRAIPDVKLTGRRPIATEGPGPSSMRLTFGSVLFEGVLRVTDAEQFRATLESGIGPGKAYGFGLLSVGPVRG